MAIRNIVTKEETILYKKSRKVEKFDGRLSDLVNDMKDTLIESNGVGLAAPQVGILKRVVLVFVEDELYTLINPEIIAKSEELQYDMEGCLSCPDEWGITERPMTVKVKAQDINGKEFEIEGSGLTARALCHELDHLDGVLFLDKVVEKIDINDLEEEE